MALERCVIVNADDFDRSPGINRGIIDAREHGIVTRVSLMVRCIHMRALADRA